MRLALQQAKSALNDQHYPVGCVIVCKEGLIAQGRNEVYRTGDYTRHGEMVALEAAFAQAKGHPALLHGATAYVTTMPCLMCAGAMIQSGVSRVVVAHANVETRSSTTEKLLADMGLGGVLCWHSGLLALESEKLLSRWGEFKLQVLEEMDMAGEYQIPAIAARYEITAAHIEAWLFERSLCAKAENGLSD